MIKEKANTYVEEKVIDILKEAFAKVYADGYRDGYKDREEEIPVDLRDNKTEYIDLGLPSGTLWSVDYEKDWSSSIPVVRFMPYDEAKNYPLPTEKQWTELFENCRWQPCCNSNGIVNALLCVGPNGKTITFSCGYRKGAVLQEHYKSFSWLYDNEENQEHEKSVMHIESADNNGHPVKRVIKIFSGYRLPVRLVKISK